MAGKYAIIAENDVSKWDDKTGVSYHFPMKYNGILTPGTNVIYYKGKLKDKKFASERRSFDPHYFGLAVIGDVSVDPNNEKQLFAEIQDYTPFTDPISIRGDNGEYFEIIPSSRVNNYWRDGVRRVAESVFLSILNHAKLDIVKTSEREIPDQIQVSLKTTDFPDIKDVTPKIVNDIFTPAVPVSGKTNSNSSDGSNSKRVSRNAKLIGDRAEKVVFEYLKSSLPVNESNSIRWLANEGEKPGYDINYFNSFGEEICIEVKGTVASGFSDFQITVNEWNSAKNHKERYFIYLVANCLSTKPNIQIISNPFEKRQNNEWELSPMAYKVTRVN